MERIQEALAKARAQRQQGNATQKKEVARPHNANPNTDAWEHLAPFKLNRAALKRNRVVAADSGPEAAPYDLMRTKIIHQCQINDWRRIAIVSPDAGAGKTTTLGNLAFSFERQRDMRILCIDLDLRRPALHTLLAQKPDHSMAEVLEGHVPFSQHGLRLGSRVALGLNNEPARNPSELLLSRVARDSLAAIEQEYAPDLTFFDISPLNGSDDNIAFLQNVDCAVIIAAAESTTMTRIDQAERQVAELTNVMGIALNKCRYIGDADEYQYY
ncbi:tyrosine-protein kinase family protein [Roseovarius sp.]|uniref:tyrosine-protein kinase family protein n=1 Tax=Roseovarius sp. TaxID=1486281 RepID=UPI003D1197CA